LFRYPAFCPIVSIIRRKCTSVPHSNHDVACFKRQVAYRAMPLMIRLLTPLSYPAMFGAPTRSRTSRLRHRKPVLCPAELWTHTEAPTGIEPVTSWVEARCSIQMSYGARKNLARLARTGSNRSTSPMSRGRSAAELQASEAAAPGFEPGPTEVTARRATVLHHAAVEERKGFGPLRRRTCADLPG
jgi:hypothetical protein